MAGARTRGLGPRLTHTPARRGGAAPLSEPPPCAPRDEEPFHTRESHCLQLDTIGVEKDLVQCPTARQMVMRSIMVRHLTHE